ncbi:MAG: BrnA antitoxin family protein [Sphingopyxis sp.]|nr:BrnA antitoxin family protein [Sphingopyxis sp.]
MEGDEAAGRVARKRGRPAGTLTSEKVSVSIRIDRDVLEYFKAGGPGWQTRINETLRQVAGL